jgi:hypothetical protein
MWPSLADTLDRSLLPADPPPSEEMEVGEAMDCRVIELLPCSQHVLYVLMLRFVVLLNKVSIHSATVAVRAELKLREEIARTYLETLLQFSLLDDVEP